MIMIDRGRPKKGEYQVRTFRIKQDSFDALDEMSSVTGLSKTYIVEQAILYYTEEWHRHPGVIPIKKFQDIDLEDEV